MKPQNLAIAHVTPAILSPNPWNSNKVTSDMEKRLRASIEEFGFYKPILARELPDGRLQILGGEHRWKVASSMGFDLVPVVNLGPIDDIQAKTIGLSDNAQFGVDDSDLLDKILQDIGVEYAQMLPYDEQDLAGMFEAQSIDLDAIGFDEEDISDSSKKTLEDVVAARPAQTHAVMRFKVPVGDQDTIEAFISRLAKDRGYTAEGDSMMAAGMVLVDLVREAAKK